MMTRVNLCCCRWLYCRPLPLNAFLKCYRRYVIKLQYKTDKTYFSIYNYVNNNSAREIYYCTEVQDRWMGNVNSDFVKWNKWQHLKHWCIASTFIYPVGLSFDMSSTNILTFRKMLQMTEDSKNVIYLFVATLVFYEVSLIEWCFNTKVKFCIYILQ